MKEIYIQPSKEGKGRVFSSLLLSYIEADFLWEGGKAQTDTHRPIWMMFAGSDNELRPFIANLQVGRKADIGHRSNEKFEVLKSAGFHAAWQRTPHGSVVTLYAPDLFNLDPGMVDPKGVEFCLLPAKSWLAGVRIAPDTRAYFQSLGVKADEELEDYLLRLAPLFVAYLDRRTRCPIVPDPRFYVQILVNALTDGLASLGRDDDRYFNSYSRVWGENVSKFIEHQVSSVGLMRSLAFQAKHEIVETFLAEQVQIYFEKVD